MRPTRSPPVSVGDAIFTASSNRTGPKRITPPSNPRANGTAKAGETIGRVTAVAGRSSPQRRGAPLPTAVNGQITGCVRQRSSGEVPRLVPQFIQRAPDTGLRNSFNLAPTRNQPAGDEMGPSPPLLLPAHSQQAVAAAAGMPPSSLSRMIRQDTAWPADRRLLPELRTLGRSTGGRFDGS